MEEAKKLAPLAAGGHQSGEILDENKGEIMLDDELIVGLEQALSVTYSTIISEFIDSDSLYLSKHCPPFSATSEKLAGKSCLAVLSERTAQAFLDAVDQAYRVDTLTMTTVVLPVPCGVTPPATNGWHAIRI